MKKKLAILLFIFSVFTLVACGNTEASSESETTDLESTSSTDAESAEGDMKEAAESAEDDMEKNTDSAEGSSEDVPEEDTGEDSESGEDAFAEEESSVSGNDPSETEAISETADSVASDGDVLYTIKTSSGGNLGMVPIVNGNAVVMMDGSYASTFQGEYKPEEVSALSLKLEEETAQAISSGEIDAWAFYRESQLRNFEFPEGVTSIGKFAFSRSGLNSVTIPEGVTSIGYAAFYHCDDLSNVVIPNSVTTIEENAFAHTPWLENWMAGGTNAEDADMPDGEETTEESDSSDESDFLIVGDGILLAYRGSEKNPELPEGVKSVVPGALGK